MEIFHHYAFLTRMSATHIGHVTTLPTRSRISYPQTPLAVSRECLSAVAITRSNLNPIIFNLSFTDSFHYRPYQYCTHNMTSMGQSPWDDIKIPGSQLGHLISNIQQDGTLSAFHVWFDESQEDMFVKSIEFDVIRIFSFNNKHSKGACKYINDNKSLFHVTLG